MPGLGFDSPVAFELALFGDVDEEKEELCTLFLTLLLFMFIRECFFFGIEL
jgi:hypothetical protein